MTGSLTVLVVDDDADVRETIADALRDEGAWVEVAENGRAALDLLREGIRPDVILLDMMMPVMDGWSFRAEQRRQPDIASIPVVIFSAHAMAHEAAEQLGAQGYLSKPLRFADLLHAMNRFRRTSDARLT